MRSRWLLLLIVPTWLLGCSTPNEVRRTSRMGEEELARYVQDTDALMMGAIKAYQDESVRAVMSQTDVTLDALTAEDGKIERAKYDEVIAERDRVLGEIGIEFNKFLAGMAKAKVSLRNYYELKKAVDYYLEQEGIDAARVGELSDLLLGDILKSVGDGGGK